MRRTTALDVEIGIRYVLGEAWERGYVRRGPMAHAVPSRLLADIWSYRTPMGGDDRAARSRQNLLCASAAVTTAAHFQGLDL